MVLEPFATIVSRVSRLISTTLLHMSVSLGVVGFVELDSAGEVVGFRFDLRIFGRHSTKTLNLLSKVGLGSSLLINQDQSLL
jgi:hypothetical protein